MNILWKLAAQLQKEQLATVAEAAVLLRVTIRFLLLVMLVHRLVFRIVMK
jgi:hypothetical protein